MLCRLQSRLSGADNQQQHGLLARTSSSRSDVLRQPFSSSQASAALPVSTSTDPVAADSAPTAALALASMGNEPRPVALGSGSQPMSTVMQTVLSGGPASTPPLRETPTQLGPPAATSVPADPLRPSFNGHTHSQFNDGIRLNSSALTRPDSTAAGSIARPPHSDDIAELQKQLQQLHSRHDKQQQPLGGQQQPQQQQQQQYQQQQHWQSGLMGVSTSPGASNSPDAEHTFSQGQTQQDSQKRQPEGRAATKSPSAEASLGPALLPVQAKQQELQQLQSLQQRPASPMGQSQPRGEASRRGSIRASRSPSPSVTGNVCSRQNTDHSAGTSCVPEAAAPDLASSAVEPRVFPAAEHSLPQMPQTDSDRPSLLDCPLAYPPPQAELLGATNRASLTPQPGALPSGRTGLSPEMSRALPFSSSPFRAVPSSQAAASSVLGAQDLASQLRASSPVRHRASPDPAADLLSTQGRASPSVKQRGSPSPHAEQALLEPHQV